MQQIRDAYQHVSGPGVIGSECRGFFPLLLQSGRNESVHGTARRI